MLSHFRRRSTVIVACVVVLLISAAVAPAAVTHLQGWLAQSSRAEGLHAPAQPSATTETLESTTGPVVVRLVSQDLTPATQIHLSASGFMPKEHLLVTVEDPQGYAYEQVTLIAGNDGRLRDTALALPPQLASGTYKVLVVGNTSHRTANVTFRMHDIPPTVALDAYTATPGQIIGVAGSGFIPGEDVLIYLGKATTPVAHLKATDLGTVSGHLTVPGLAPGNYTLSAVGSVSQTPIALGLSIQGFAPWVILDRYTLTPGQGLGFIGQDFAPNEPVLVYLNATNGNPALSLTADPSGRIVEQDTWMPSAASGSNALTFVGQWSKATTTASFTVLPAAEQPTPTAVTP